MSGKERLTRRMISLERWRWIMCRKRATRKK